MIDSQNRHNSFAIAPSELLDKSDASNEVACATRAQE